MIKIEKVKLTKEQASLFPDDLSIVNKVFSVYFNLGLMHDAGALVPLSTLNKAQKALCYYWIATGKIDNGGLWSVLLEGLGNYDEGFIESLEIMGDNHDLKIYRQVVSIFNDHKKYFMQMEIPPGFDEESPEHDPQLWEHLDQLEKAWYAYEPQRQMLLKQFLKDNLDELVEVSDIPLEN